MEILSIPLITAIVYGFVSLLKATFKSEKFKNFLPIISGVMGAVLGVVAFFVSPEIILANNFLQAMLLGLVSGLTATGSNQIIKQMQQLSTKKPPTDETDSANKDNN